MAQAELRYQEMADQIAKSISANCKPLQNAVNFYHKPNPDYKPKNMLKGVHDEYNYLKIDGTSVKGFDRVNFKIIDIDTSRSVMEPVFISGRIVLPENAKLTFEATFAYKKTDGRSGDADMIIECEWISQPQEPLEAFEMITRIHQGKVTPVSIKNILNFKQCDVYSKDLDLLNVQRRLSVDMRHIFIDNFLSQVPSKLAENLQTVIRMIDLSN